MKTREKAKEEAAVNTAGKGADNVKAKITAKQNKVAGKVKAAVADPEAEIDAKEKAHEAELLEKSVRNGKLDIYALKKVLGLKKGTDSDESDDSDELEEILNKVGDLNKRGNYIKLFSMVADRYVASQSRYGFQNWSHSLCHTFEKYGRSYGGKAERSLLNSPHNLEGCTKLIDETVKRTIANRDVACSSRIVNPLMNYNIDRADFDNLEADYAYKPDSLTNENFCGLYSKDKYDSGFLPFLRAKNPREMLIGLVKLDLEKDKEGYYGPSIRMPVEKLVKLLEKLQPDLTPDQIEEYLKLVIYGKTSREAVNIDDLKANLEQAEKATEVVDEVCVDVGDTLIIYDEYKKEERLNDALVKKLLEMAKLGRKVVIITGGDTEYHAEKLRKFGMDESLLNVRAKDEYKGKIVDIVIDDILPQVQAIKAVHYFAPSECHFWVDEQGRVTKK